MSYWVNKLDELIERQKNAEIPLTIESISDITLSEFARREIAVEIYSEYLDCTLWLCSNSEMANQLRRDDPDKTCYTLEEIKHLLSLNPSIESLKQIHEAKVTFPSSKIGDSNMNQLIATSLETDKGLVRKKRIKRIKSQQKRK